MKAVEKLFSVADLQLTSVVFKLRDLPGNQEEDADEVLCLSTFRGVRAAPVAAKINYNY